MTDSTPEQPYAKCQDCDIHLADRDAVNAHSQDTLAPTGEPGVCARSHVVSIINPTEGERRASRVRSHISDALGEAYRDLQDAVERGYFTTDEVNEGILMFDLSDGWDQFMAEA